MLAASGAPVLAADLVKQAPAPVAAPAPVNPWDIAFGGVVMTDYNFRGVSQSNRGPSAGAYFEPQLNTGFGTLYVGLAGYAIEWPSTTPPFGFTDPSAEIDIYGGWRNTWGAFSLDLGLIYYWYPEEIFNGFTRDSDFLEIYAKGAYAITPAFTIGANVFYTPDLLNYSETFRAVGVNQDADALYASLTAKWVTPWTYGDLGAYISASSAIGGSTTPASLRRRSVLPIRATPTSTWASPLPTRRSARPALPRHGSEPPRLQKLPGRVGAQSRERLV